MTISNTTTAANRGSNRENQRHHYNNAGDQPLTLREKMRDCGIEPPDFIKAGVTTRFSTNGKSHDRSGWVFLFDDECGASFGCWRSGACGTWQAEHDRPLSKIEKDAFARQLKEAQKAAKLMRDTDYAEAAYKARDEWYMAQPAPAEHAYLIKKGIRPGVARLGADDRLMIPVYGSDGSVQSIQRIAPDGQKRFMSGGKTSGGHVWVGLPKDGATLLLSEGWATASLCTRLRVSRSVWHFQRVI